MPTPLMPLKILSVLRSTAGKTYFKGVLTPTGWRLRSKTTGRFVSSRVALGFSHGIGRTFIKMRNLTDKIDYLSQEFKNELLTNRELRNDMLNYLRQSAGYPQEEL